MGQHRLVAPVEIGGAGDTRGAFVTDSFCTDLINQVFYPPRKYALPVTSHEKFVSCNQPFRIKRTVVVEFQGCPRLPLPHVCFGVTGFLVRLNSDFVAHNMVGVRVPTDLVVTDHHMRAVLTH